ncbi:MAG: bifunctional lysylphosphatidylglycerol flippase/synthetase MprF [Alphaproteobacteria bacterium]|nr:bifunctional lysylphosphatidylglycerol flippase/synthetase MprF [Alphaproteobacteria bacterium]
MMPTDDLPPDASPLPWRGRWPPPWQRLAPIWALATFIVAIYLIHTELGSVSMNGVYWHLNAYSASTLFATTVATLLGHAALSFQDFIAFRHLTARPPRQDLALASFTSNAVGNTVGSLVLLGSALQTRIYLQAGLPPEDCALFVRIKRMGLYVGALIIAGAGLLLEPGPLQQHYGMPVILSVLIGVVCLAGAGALLWRSLSIAGVTPASALYRLFASLVDWSMAALVLYLLLPESTPFGFASFLPIFALACLAGGLSGLPAGIGVFEAVILLLVTSQPVEAVIGALILLRAIYYLMPLALAGLTLGASTIAQSHRQVLKGVSQGAGGLADLFTPPLFALLAFASGAYMLAAAMTPALPGALQEAGRFLPLPVIEVSHFLASIIGFLLLIVANGLARRLSHAWAAGLVLLILGIGLTLAKGATLGEAVPLAVVLGVLALSRGAFYRATPLSSVKLTPVVLLAIAATIGAAIWLGFFSYEHVEYRDELWWQFALHGGTSRFLRAAGGVSALGLLFLAWNWLRPVKRPAQTEAPPAMDTVANLIATAKAARPDAALALSGDKQFHFSPSGNSFIMFSPRGRSWIAMSEPVGDPDEFPSLVWSFRKAADTAGCGTVFYAVSRDFLPLAADLGLTVQKVGETAIIPLADFSLEGPARSGLRQTVRRGERDGLSFDVITAENVPAMMDQLATVSDDWLAAHEGAEKSFSLGRFDPDYISHSPVGVARLGDEVVAFANIWEGAGKRDRAIDLMRFSSAAPKSVMEYLFIQLLLWAKDQGGERFDLGMAPLAGLESHRLAPALSRLGTFIYEHAGSVYGFEGLRAYKQKFRPDWEPLYLATSNSRGVATALADVAILTSGGLVSMFRK